MPAPLTRRDLLASATAAAVGSVVTSLARAAESKPRIKIGQIGVGHAHATKLSVYRDTPEYEVVGIVEPDKELREKAKDQPAFRDLPFISEEQLLNTPGLSAVLV